MSDVSTGGLTADERWVVECAGRGQFAAFDETHAGKPAVRATVVRSLLLGEIPQGAGSASSGMAGVRISGARIVGELDLSDCARPGTGLPTLELQNCCIPEPIDLSAARLAKLSLMGSRFTFVNLCETDIDGPFDFSDASGFENTDCWIDARGALIQGQLTGERVRLRVGLPPEEGAALTPGDRRRALCLAGATIRGSVRLIGSFEGGVSLDAARVTGDVRIDGGQLAAEDGYALRAQNASIDGVMLVRNSIFRGIVWLLGLRTGGALQMRDTRIEGIATRDLGRLLASREMPNAAAPDTEAGAGNPREAADERRDALIANDADIGTSLRLTPNFTACGRVSFATSKIRGELEATGARLHQPQQGHARAAQITNTEIGASLILDDADVQGRLDMAGARIGGKLSILGARLANRTVDGKSKALEAINASVGGNAEFGRDESTEQRRGTVIDGAVDFTSARIGGNLAFTGANIDNLSAGGEGHAIVARQAQVQASILLNGNFHAQGAVILTGATVGRDLACDHATLSNPEYSAIYAKDIEVGDDIKFLHSEITGYLRFERAMVAGSVHWHDLTLKMPAPPNGSPQRLARFEFVHARVGSTLKCAGIDHQSPCRIDLRGLRVATIDLRSANGWGNSHCNDEPCPVALDGMIYDRIVFPEPPAPGVVNPKEAAQREQAHVRLRKRAKIPVEWPWRWALPSRDESTERLLNYILRDSINDAVAMQGRDLFALPGQGRRNPGESFNPQPFRQLTRVLRAQGFEDIARKMAIYEQWAAPPAHLVHRMLRFLWGCCFGFGLWPRRAAMTLLVYVGIGWLATVVALHKDLLVETPQIAAANYLENAQGKAEFAFMQADQKGGPQHELVCSEITDKWFDAVVYAADTVLPFIPLHQETKCELKPEWHFLRFLRAAYTVLGWAVTSLALLTFSGIVRRFDGPSG
ncbi:MAG: hypothetical protein ABSE20_20615 [Acetobacteraceae bacterium]